MSVSPCMNHTCTSQGFCHQQYVLPALPYEADALEPLLDAETVLLHHDKHHASYVEGANNAARILRMAAAGELDASAASVATQQLAFHLGGHILHSLYWQSITPQSGLRPEGKLAKAVESSFGSYEGFLKLFNGIAMGVQGSGWCVLGVNPVNRELVLCGITRHQDAVLPGVVPLLACDVWEHAYYLRYRNNRAAYLSAFLKQTDWASAEERFNNLCICHE